jgi:hypothetical protein
MSADRIERLDAHGEPFELLTGAALRFELGSTMKEGVLVGLMAPNSCMVTFDEEQATEMTLFLLKAAGVDIVGAAQVVVRAAQRGGFQCWSEAEQQALDALSAELAKLDGGA